MTQFDYVVIGAGSAGAVIANRLTEDPETTVLLLEAGTPDTKLELSIPAKWITLLGTEVDWAYLSEEEPYLNNRKIFHPRGKVLGGSSSINAMIYIRGNANDYDRWQALGNPGWNYLNVLLYFKKSENQQQGASEFHGIDGPLTVSDPLALHPLSSRFVAAARKLGYNHNPDFNGAQQEGAGLYQLTVKEGRRQSTAAAYLHPILERSNLTIQTGALVTRILLEGRRAYGVVYTQNGTECYAPATQEIILSAGVFDSPKLLMLSGIGSAEHLQALDIPVIADLPGVGQNLHDHMLVSVGYQSTQELPPLAPTSNLVESGLFLHSGESNEVAPDLQFLFCPALWVSPDFARDVTGFTFIPCLIAPQSRGTVMLQSANPADPPAIQVNYIQHESDLQVLIEGIKVARQFAHSGAFDEFLGEEVAPGSDVTSDEAIAAYIRQAADTYWHPVGTCKMGNDSLAVVDAQLRVHGIEGLRVVDASVMPTIPSGNTNAPTIMIGEKAAALIKALHQ